MPRQTDLTPAIQKKIVAAIRKGNYFNVACELAGIPEKTGQDWLYRGLGTHPDRDDREPFAGFAVAIKKAESDVEQAAIARIQEAAAGREVKKTKQTVMPDGTKKLEEATETVTDWTADAWFLERKFPFRWGRRKTDEDLINELMNRGYVVIRPVESENNGANGGGSTQSQSANTTSHN